MKNISFLIATLLFGSIVILQFACKKEEDNVDTEPSDQFTDPRDGQSYSFVTIGDQTWMIENLNYVTSNSWQHDSLTNCDVYGRLYTWDEAIHACPSGWHLPRDYEWSRLIDFLGGDEVAGGKMKETGTTHWDSPNTGATNSSGFTGLPGGCRYSVSELFDCLGDAGFWWSHSGQSNFNASRWSLGYNNEAVRRFSYDKGYGFSVRCIKDRSEKR